MEDLFKQINQEKIAQYQAHLEKLELSKATIKRRLSSLRKFYNWAEKEGYLEKLPQKAPVIKEIPSIKRLKYLTSKLRPTFPSMPTIPFISDAYEVYQSISITKYLHYAILIIFCVGLGIGIYNQLTGPKAELAEAYPTSLISPNRYLSFQGRLTDSSNNPISESTDFVFKLYNDEGTGCPPSGGVQLWSGSCSINPDEDGIFSVLLGKDCGSEIDDSVFSENPDVWLEITVGTDPYDEILCPRIQIATVGYALNAETLQGYPPGTGINRIPYIDNTGKITIAAASPTIESSSGTFAITGQALSITTATGSDGNIVLAPNGVGTLNINVGGTGPGGQVQITDANITSGSLVSVYAGTSATGFDLLNLSSGTPETTVFSVDESGNTYVAGNLGVGTTNPGAKLDIAGDVKIGTVNNVSDNNQVLTVDSGIVKYIDTTNWDKDSGDDYGAWLLAGDSGTPQNIGAGDTASIVGGIGIGTTASATDTLTINVDESYGFAWTGAQSWSSTATFNGTLDANSTVTLGDNGENVTIDSSVWDISGAGAGSGFTQFTVDNIDLNGNTIAATDNGGLFLYDNASNGIFIEDGGMVGIGTTDPSQKLHIAGAMRLENALYDLNNQAGTNGQILSTTGSGVNWVDIGTIGVGGTGTTGYVPRWISSSTLGDSVIYDDGTNVGIGTTNPADLLSIVQTTTTGSALDVSRDLGAASTDSPLVNLVQDNTGDDQSVLNIQNDGTGVGLKIDQSGNSHGIFVDKTGTGTGYGIWVRNYSDTDQGIRVEQVGDTTGMFFDKTGTGAGDGLWARNAGTGRAAYFEQTGNGVAVQIQQKDDDQRALWIINEGSGEGIYLNSTSTGNLIKLEKSATEYFLVDSSGNIKNYGYIYPGSGSGEQSTVYLTGSASGLGLMGGNVGIGTTSPSGKLQVVGDEVRIGDGGTLNYASGDGDLYVENVLEVDGTIYGNVVGGVTPTGFDEGPVVFGGTGGALDQDDAFWWDNSSKEVGIGTTNPGAKLDVVGNILVNNGGTIDTRAAGTLTIGGTTQNALTLGKSGATTSLIGSNVTLGGIAWGGASNTLAFTSALTGMLKGNNTSAPTAITSTQNYVTYWLDANTISGEQYLATSRGGLGANVTAAGAGELLYSSGTITYGHLAAGTSGYILKAASAAAPTWNVPAALTKTDDTNVTLTLGGSPSTALVNAASITVNWSGQLSLAKGGTNKNMTASAGSVAYSDADSLELTAVGTSGYVLTSAGTGTPTWTAPGGLGIKWNSLQNPDGALSLTMGTNTTTFNWATGTGANNLFSFTTDASANGTGSLVNIQTGASATLSPLRVRAGSTESIFVKSDGSVGIGTTGPGNKLEVNGNIEASWAGNAWLGFYASATDYGYMRLGNGLNLVNVQSTDGANDISFYTGTGSEVKRMFIEGTAGDVGLGGNITTGLTGSTLVAKGSGNVGIGTTNPGAKLHLSSTETAGVASTSYYQSKQEYVVNPSSSATTSYYVGNNISVSTSGNTNPLGHLYGLYSSVSAAGTGSIVSTDGIISQLANSVSNGSLKNIWGHGVNYNTVSDFFYGIQGNVDNWANTSGTGNINSAKAGRFRLQNYTQNDLGAAGPANMTTAQVVYANIWNGATGTLGYNATIGTATGFRYDLTNSTGGQITNSYGIYLSAPSNSGTITNHYGIYLADQTVSGTTDNFAIYSAGGKNYFAGNVGIGTTNPGSYKLNVTGTATFNNAGVTIDSNSFVNADRFTDKGTDYYIDPAHSTISGLFAGNVGIGTTNPGAKLDITKINTDNAKAINLAISADTDGDDVYGIYNTIDTGTGTLSSGDRNSYGLYNNISIGAGGSLPYYLTSSGVANAINITANYAMGEGAYNLMDVTGTDSNAAGVYNRSYTGDTVGTDSALYGMISYFNPETINSGASIGGVTSAIYLNDLSSGTATAYGVRNDLLGMGTGTSTLYGVKTGMRTASGDVGYAYYADTGSMSSGGTQYGLYVNLNDGEVTNYSVYVTDDSGISYFGSSVGIGTMSPAATLSIWKSSGDAPVEGAMINISRTAWPGSYVGIRMGYNDSSYMKGGIFFERTGGNSVGSLHFATDNTADASNVDLSDARMTINNLGYVGIGTTSPSGKLHINDGAVIIDKDYGIRGDSLNVGARNYIWALSNTYSTRGMSYYEGTPDYISIHPGGTNVLAVTDTGRVGIGDVSPEGVLDLEGLGSGDVTDLGIDGNNTVTIDTSLLEFKENIEDLSLGLETVMQLQPREFDWIEEKGGMHDLGFIAEEIEEINPLLAQYHQGKLQTVKYKYLTALLTRAIQEQQGQIESLSGQLDELYLTDTGDLLIEEVVSEDGSKEFVLKDAAGEVIDRIGAFAEATIANLRVGSLRAAQIITDTLSSTQINTDKLISPLVETEQLTATKVISDQLSATSIEATESKFGKIMAEQVTSDQLSVTGDATIAGTLYADKVVANEVVGLEGKFGELIAATVSAQKIQGLEERLAQLESENSENQNVGESDNQIPPDDQDFSDPMEDLELSPDIEALVNEILGTSLEATPQAELADVYGDNLDIANNLTVLGSTSLADTSIAGSLNVGGTMTLADNSINTLTGPLYLQNLGLGGIDILAGKITIDAQGNAVFEGDVTIKGRLALSEIEPLPEGDLMINLSEHSENSENQNVGESDNQTSGFGRLLVKGTDDEIVASIEASGTATFKKLAIAKAEEEVTQVSETEIETNATAGQAILPAGETEIIIKSQFVTDKTMVYVTPISDTQNKVLFVKAKKAQKDALIDEYGYEVTPEEKGWFKVAIDTIIDTDIEFNWWVIN